MSEEKEWADEDHEFTLTLNKEDLVVVVGCLELVYVGLGDVDPTDKIRVSQANDKIIDQLTEQLAFDEPVKPTTPDEDRMSDESYR